MALTVFHRKEESMPAKSKRAGQLFPTHVEWIVLAVLVLIAIAARFWIETPNFKPLAAFALFGGFFFRKPTMAICGTMLVLVITDLKLGFYPWQLMVCVYLSMVIAVLLGLAIRKRLGASVISLAYIAGFLGASLAMSTSFYLLTNGGVWLLGSWYPMTFAGLTECYLAGLPFYRWTLLGDLFFTTVTVGSYWIALWFAAYLQQVSPRKKANPLLRSNC